MEVTDRPGRQDPIWQYLLETRLDPYLPKVREWWANVERLTVPTTGVYDIPEGPPGLKYRFTRSAKKSPILNIQAFPFVPTAFLQLIGIQGGSNKMVESTCPFKMHEFTIVAKSNLPSTYSQGQFIAFIPTIIYDGIKVLGQWIYVTRDELVALSLETVPGTIIDKARLKL